MFTCPEGLKVSKNMNKVKFTSQVNFYVRIAQQHC